MRGTQERFFDTLPIRQDQPLLKLMMKFMYLALFGLYALGVVAGVYCPTPAVGYMFAVGNLVRVLYFVMIRVDLDKYVRMQFNEKTLNTILGVQTLLGLVIAGCTYASAQKPEYQARGDHTCMHQPTRALC